MNILSRISVSRKGFTKSQKKIADKILEDPQKVLSCSISEFAEECGVGDATVCRFCKAVDMQGFQGLKHAIARALIEIGGDDPKGSNDGKADLLPFISDSASIPQMLDKLVSADIKALEETRMLIQEIDVIQAVKMMTDAGKVLFLGVGASYLTAEAGFQMFSRITPKVSCIGDTHSQYAAAALCGPGDVAVIVSYSGESMETLEMAKAVKDAGGKIICVTRYLKSALTAYADVILLSGVEKRLFEPYTVSLKMSEFFIMEILYEEYFRRTRAESEKNRDTVLKALINKQM